MPNNNPADSGDTCQLKAGHPPAVKVGNMRVTQRTHSTSSNSGDKNDDSKDADGSVPQACSFAPKTVVKQGTSGVPDTLAPNVPEAVKKFHDKPQATHEHRSHPTKPNVGIQQPKK